MNFSRSYKTYGLLNHEVLLSKLNSYGIRGMTNLWFETCLSHIMLSHTPETMCGNNYREKRVHVSTKREIEHGVPHFSILGPLITYLLTP